MLRAQLCTASILGSRLSHRFLDFPDLSPARHLTPLALSAAFALLVLLVVQVLQVLRVLRTGGLKGESVDESISVMFGALQLFALHTLAS